MARDDGAGSNEIEINGLSKMFGLGAAAFQALDAIDLSIRQNEFFTLLGPSGCGKTTLLRIIAGFEQPTTGALRINGQDMAGSGPNARPVNTVFQNYALFPHMTVAQNIGFGLKMLGRSRTEIDATTADMLRLVRMEALAGRRPAEISGGQQQRVALARALAPRPRVLLLDEPLSALDSKLRKGMQTELKRLQGKTGITFVFVTHDQEEALTMSDRIAVMSEGRILQIGTPHEIYHAPRRRFVADFIGDTNFLEADLLDSRDGQARVRLPGGTVHDARLPAGARPAVGARVTVVVRPEQVQMVSPESAGLCGTVERAVFFGTDTHVHLLLPGSVPVTLRRQNSTMQDEPAPGTQVGLRFSAGALQVLGD